MSFSAEVVISALVILATVASAWGDLRARLGRIEKMVGNGGGDSVFERRDEARLTESSTRRVHDELDERIGRLEAWRISHMEVFPHDSGTH